MKSNGYIISEEHNVIYYTAVRNAGNVWKAGHQTGTAYPSASGGQFCSFIQYHITTAMQYGQIVFLLFVAMVFYYAAMIFMDFQRAKAAQNAEQDSHKEEDIDISEEARSFKPIRINRDGPESKEENQEENNIENPGAENENSDSDSTEKSASKSESPRHVYREAIMTDGILVENIIQEINRLVETVPVTSVPLSSAVRMPDIYTVPLVTSVSLAMKSFNIIQKCR